MDRKKPAPDDAVWELLAKAAPRRASGVFVQNTVRRVRQLQAESEGAPWFGWISRRSFAVSAAAAILLAIAVAIPAFMRPKSPQNGPQLAQPAISEQEVEALTEELEVLTMMNEFLAVGDPTQLDDEALAELLF